MVMRRLCAVVLIFVFSIFSVSSAFAGQDQDTQAKLDALEANVKAMQDQYQKQIGGLQAQVDALKVQLAAKQEVQPSAQNVTPSAVQAAKQPFFKSWLFEDHPVIRPDTFVDRTFKQNGGLFRLRDAVGMTDESKLNIGGELKMRYRQNQRKTATIPGFQFYELELFMDATLNDYSSVYMEYNLMHETAPEPEDVWMDFHLKPGEIAATGNTGVKIGNIHYPFGWDNDDNEGYVYGGRTSVNTSLIRGQRVDGWRLRERQLGAVGNYNFDAGPVNFTATAGVFNGSGSWKWSASDNDQMKDFAGRLEAKFADLVVGASALYAPYTRGKGANSNDTQHMRDIYRYGFHFKYPDVPFPAQDMSLGGKRWLIWGEYIFGENRANNDFGLNRAFDNDIRVYGGYIEGDVVIISDKLLGFCRFDYYYPDATIKDGYTYGVTPGIKFNFLGSSYLIAQYEFYDGGTAAPTSIVDEDRVTLEVSTMF